MELVITIPDAVVKVPRTIVTAPFRGLKHVHNHIAQATAEQAVRTVLGTEKGREAFAQALGEVIAQSKEV